MICLRYSYALAYSGLKPIYSLTHRDENKFLLKAPQRGAFKRNLGFTQVLNAITYSAFQALKTGLFL
jgi:hypothetical protein